LLGIAAFSTSEFIREAVRKPYIVYNVVFGNQIRPKEVFDLKENGVLAGGVWPRSFVEAKYPELIAGDRIDPQRLASLPPQDQIALGQVLFQYQCNNCHAVERGYSAVGPLLRGRPPEMVEALINELEQAHFFMPPWAGTPQEAKLLTAYLMEIRPPRPQGMALGPATVEAK
jgi:mono/diheme cytochrome c family protein